MDRPWVAILGIGQMGASAAVCFRRAGFPVLLWARDAVKLAGVPATLAQLDSFLDEQVGPVSTPAGAVETTTDLDRVNGMADVVLECIAEDLGQKADLLRQLAPAARRNAVLTSCTSGLSISAMGAKSGVGRRLVGAHFWNPPHLMPVVEVIRGAETDDGLVEDVSALLRRAGKRPVVCKDVPGFIGNRLLHALFREAIHLVQQGICSAADVDLVARMTFGLRLPALGPCENMDLVGLELLAQIQSYLLADLSDAKETMPLVRQLLAAGRLGMKAGHGLRDWSERRPAEVIALRDRQIVNQLRFLQAMAGAQDGASKPDR
jgi:3-hydroxybutyryl-CoA dehydrogenase